MGDPTRDSLALKMYSQKRASVDITPSDPQFVAQYVGKTEVFVASGKGCTQRAVQKIWDDFYDEKGMKRVSILINSAGIVMKDLEGSKNNRETVFDIKEIAYCCAEQGIHERIFAWICKEEHSKKLACHSVLCSSKERAQLMSLTMHQAFRVAYKDWKRARDKKLLQKHQRKENHRHPAQQQQQLPQQNGHVPTIPVPCRPSSSQESDSLSEDNESCSSDGMSSLLETIVAQMNLVEEEELSMMDNAIVIETN